MYCYACFLVFKIISIKDLIEYRIKTDSLIEEIVRVDMPTKYGHFKLVAFKEKLTQREHLAMIKGEWEKGEAACGFLRLVRGDFMPDLFWIGLDDPSWLRGSGQRRFRMLLRQHDGFGDG